MVKNKQTIQAKSLNNGFDSSEKKQTNQKQQLEWIQSGSAIYFKPTSQVVISSSA